ncbi:hypothetical protein B1222_21040 [Paenibacillus larvae subsp. pulvifaciens]|uniref:hypothetical protein n=1 Tax=Paenibacillus larvae TaxID=1464 RepID=UPI0009901CCF|nr:hypothetical protein [Paenibacillus larvae]AQT86332.1 hypothetical protein B1222_21040 [Paenibacillus larvae subsp. pulvifaciens]AQZ47982.1 hypothetical protein B5S25_16690 [Paenibacillus larvae subsp. pulvifaciens]MBH0343600.1 hypothetical protein [Paenibacillus larvae]MCY7522298.1 hypothetical protein [Paenibacillus larvae]MCY9503239.1 hypothetical protein [Paenibacillus larvae]
MEKLLSVEFPERDILVSQLKNAKVIGNYLCGCRTIDINIDSTCSKFPNSKRVPVEMIIHNGQSAPIIFYLHVLNGYIKELEIFKADSKPISEKFELNNAQININVKND